MFDEMKIVVNKEFFKNVIEEISSTFRKRKNDFSSFLCLRAKNDNLIVTVENSEITRRITIPCEVKEEGKFYINIEKIKAVLPYFDGKQSIFLEKEKDMIKISTDNFVSLIFEDIVADLSNSIDICYDQRMETSLLLDGIKKMGDFKNDKNSRYFLDGILITEKDDKIKFILTDENYMRFFEKENPFPKIFDEIFILRHQKKHLEKFFGGKTYIKVCCKSLDNYTHLLAFKTEEDKLFSFFRSDELVLRCPISRSSSNSQYSSSSTFSDSSSTCLPSTYSISNFPDYNLALERYIPCEKSFIFHIDRSLFIQNLKKSLKEEKENHIMLEITNTTMNINKEIIPISIMKPLSEEKQELRIKFNIQYLLQSLAVMDSRNVCCSIIEGNSTSALVITGEKDIGFKAFIMPIKL